MELSGEKLLVTGGAGFVGSHLVERLHADNDLVVVDDFSNGRRAWLPDGVTVIEGDLTDPETVTAAVTEDLDGVFHLAAGKDVNDPDPRDQFEANTTMTYNLLQRMHAVGVSALAYTSSSTVYGEAPRPTPEDHPLEPISAYGASKVAEEALLSVYAHSHNFDVWSFRFANVVGPRLQSGAVIVDFIEKLLDAPSRLEILGDGRQEKSYLHISECIEAMCHAIKASENGLTPLNLGTSTMTSVTTIADIVSDEMGLDPTYEFSGGDRGWVGDVPRMRLSIERLRSLGWEPQMTSDEAVRRATSELVAERT